MLAPVSPSGWWTQDDALQWLTGRDKAPERNDQFACQRDDHGLAGATTAVGGAGALPQCQRAVLLKPKKAPGELDHGGVWSSGLLCRTPPRARATVPGRAIHARIAPNNAMRLSRIEWL